MKDFQGVLSLQVDSLLKTLQGRQEERCRELITEAEKQASELLRRSRHEQRERVRQAVEEERKRRELALQQARNRIQAAESQKVQAIYTELLQEAWPELDAALNERWSHTAGRKAWCDMLITEAETTLGPTTWTIEHPDDWSEKDEHWLTRALGARGIPKPSYQIEPSIRAGLKIRRDTACLDGTIDGVLSRRIRVESRLLAAWERLARTSSGEQRG